MEKYAYELKKNDIVKYGKGSEIVEKVRCNFWDNFCFIHTDTGKVIKSPQDKKFKIIG